MEKDISPFRAPKPGEPRRALGINFTEDQYQELEDLAAKEGKTISDTVRGALRREQLVQQTILEGGEIHLIKADGTDVKILIRG